MKQNQSLLLFPLFFALSVQATPMKQTKISSKNNIQKQAALTKKSSSKMLTKYHWLLSHASSNNQTIAALFVSKDKSIQLDFNQNRLNISNSCNKMFGNYTLSHNKLNIAPLASTLMSCADSKLSQLDGEIAQRLQGSLSYTLKTTEQPQLTLITKNGDILVFTGEETAQTRYGSNGTTEFLEIAPQTKACSHPLIPNKQCLEVRQIQYDANGLKTTQGNWTLFYQDIEGYTHQKGIRNIVRVKNYPIKNVPADAPNSAYILDMIVESETVQNKPAKKL